MVGANASLRQRREFKGHLEEIIDSSLVYPQYLRFLRTIIDIGVNRMSVGQLASRESRDKAENSLCKLLNEINDGQDADISVDRLCPEIWPFC